MQGSDAADLEARFVAMFRAEWQAERGEAPLRSIAIVDENPPSQYLYPSSCFSSVCSSATASPPGSAIRPNWPSGGGALRHAGERVDLVYNRLTDFSLEAPASAALREAWLAGAAVMTPHPRAHALYADKRNLALLTDAAR
jgi:hypothetical protein